ncbi:MAG TPA: phosphoribosylamine--glycine ligase [Acidimicrobiales bacterium]|nr:phosphoribosylamine--glycine ligase [Acidimicrobiales bacterium]
MRVAVVGNGGREHAFRQVLSRTATVVPDDADDADLYVIGPEQPLVDGVADRLRADGKLVLGPGADGARLEGSKGWMKEVLRAAGVPTARSATFATAEGVDAYLADLPSGAVVKTDYLAAGKGVLVSTDADALRNDARAKLAHGDVVIEELLAGPELSVFAVCNGKDFVLLPPARDHKRVGDGDTGPNTGGMGAFSPVPDVDAAVEAAADMVDRTLGEFQRRGIDYRGILFAGLMLTPDGPKMLEYNVRLGDPEAQVVLPRFTSDLAELLAAAAAGDPLPPPTFTDAAAVTVVLAAEGYPVDVRTGDVIEGVDDAEALDGVTVFEAGVVRDDTGRLRTAGGRVLAVTALAATLAEARERAYEAVQQISWPGMHYRKDIAAQ